MEIAGEYRIAADKQTVWEALNDPEILRASIPGCESVERHSDTQLTAVVKIRMGPVRATFKGKVTLSDLDPPNSYTISGEGEGGVAGFGRGSARVSLADVEGETLLTYAAKAEVGGKLAQIGSRLVESATRKLSKDFFENFSKVVETGGAEPTAPVQPSPGGTPAPQSAVVSEPATGSSLAGWSAGLAAIILTALFFLTSGG